MKTSYPKLHSYKLKQDNHHATFRGCTPETILKDANDIQFKHAIILGIETNGKLYFSRSHDDDAINIWMLERAKNSLL
jgi:hypothetical protein